MFPIKMKMKKVKIDYIQLLIILIISLNLILFIFNYNLYTPFYNDILRLVLVLIFLRTTFSLYDRIELGNFFTLFSKISISILFLICIVQFLFFEIFELYVTQTLIDFESLKKWGEYRISATIRDSNILAYHMIVYMYFIFLNKHKKSNYIFYLLGLFIVFITGSRMGLLTLALLFLLHFNFKKIKINHIVIFFTIFISSFILFQKGYILQRFNAKNQIEMNSNEESNSQRIESLISGYSYITSHFFNPVGNIYFRNSWSKNSKSYHYPHSSFLYLFCEFGILIIPILILLTYIMFLKFSKIQLLFLAIPMAFLPGVFYYFIVYFPLIISPKNFTNAIELKK